MGFYFSEHNSLKVSQVLTYPEFIVFCLITDNSLKMFPELLQRQLLLVNFNRISLDVLVGNTERF